jgi:thiamine pyrophosphokinase
METSRKSFSHGEGLLGIIFTGGDGPPPQVIRRLLEGKDALLVAADSGLAAVEEAGFRPGWIIGDMDSLDDESRLSGYSPQCVMRYDHDKDFTDTELALSLITEKGAGETWIIGGGGGRIDHLFGIRSLFERETFPCRWVTDSADIRCIEAAAVKSDLFLRLEAGAVVSVFPLGIGPWKAKSSGLKWPLDGLSWNRGSFGVSNEAVEGQIFIRAEQGRFMVIIPFPLGEEINGGSNN